MAQTIVQTPTREEVGHPIIGANSTTFSVADPVSINSSGFLTTATAGSKIIGWCLEAKVTTSTNQTVAKYAPQWIPAEGVTVRLTADAAVTQAMLANNVFKDLGTVTSGSMTVATATITGGQLKIVGFDPDGDGTTTIALVTVAEREKDAYAQA